VSRDRPCYVDDVDVFLPLFLSVSAQAYAVRCGVTASSVVGAVPLVGFAAVVAWRRWRDHADTRVDAQPVVEGSGERG
jgi:hypothetical protein